MLPDGDPFFCRDAGRSCRRPPSPPPPPHSAEIAAAASCALEGGGGGGNSEVREYPAAAGGGGPESARIADAADAPAAGGDGGGGHGGAVDAAAGREAPWRAGEGLTVLALGRIDAGRPGGAWWADRCAGRAGCRPACVHNAAAGLYGWLGGWGEGGVGAQLAHPTSPQ